MSANAVKPIRCAIYTRKSTEHGLELEFNSLHAQREACEAYIKSQTFQGWQPLSHHYDDAAYSGGNLERPALKRLLADIESQKVDVVVVYKIDRLTRSLADFAKLVEVFDARSVSFVAVTQQFNTTTSMGRLTLNVLLSFAQFERELSSERVKDKIAASRKKGKWTGGTTPLGYDIKDKKLVINAKESQAVRTIFQRYLDLKSIGALIQDLDSRKIVTKKRNTRVEKFRGGIAFTSGPLSFLLRNRVYLGEMHHAGKWFKGEHKAIIDRKVFNQAEKIRTSNTVERGKKQFATGALLMGKLFDDRGNLMSPSFTLKKGIRYRCYVSRAIWNGRNSEAGQISRVPASIETTVINGLRLSNLSDVQVRERIRDVVEKIVVTPESLNVFLKSKAGSKARSLLFPWSPKDKVRYERADGQQSAEDQKLIHAVVRAHAWLDQLKTGAVKSIHELAQATKLNEKVVRLNLRLAYLAPDITQAILEGRQGALTLSKIPQVLPLDWSEQRKVLGLST
ncbi:MAG: recombinase family protein [Rhizobiales bacterium]|nr:recombinase family protein [Hyphomicrobiales bacterium]